MSDITLPLFALQPETREIPLTQGKVAIVDAADYAYLSQWRWHALKAPRTFYAVRHSITGHGKQVKIYMHALLVSKGVDHIDGDGLNNTRANLRPATQQQNQFNRGPQANNTSGFKGVTLDKRRNKWRACIRVNRKQKSLGYFATAEDAARAYNEAAVVIHGQFAKLNEFGRELRMMECASLPHEERAEHAK